MLENFTICCLFLALAIPGSALAETKFGDQAVLEFWKVSAVAVCCWVAYVAVAA